MAEIKSHTKSSLLELDATEIALLIREGKISSEECTKEFIEQINAVNPVLNAVTETRFSEALHEAREKDSHLKDLDLDKYPLYGVPISIKESINVQGMKTTGGLHHRKDIIMSKDAATVKMLKEAGAIVICKTNTPSLCFCHETENKVYGKTNNSWDINFTSGGSSGGEAALISTGGSPVGLGSDIGGSIRIPSHFNGVAGFKPGKFQIDTEGHFPPDTVDLKNRMSTIGPIGKSVRDLELLYNIIKKDNQTSKRNFYERMTIEMLPADNGFPLSEDTSQHFSQVQQFLSERYNTNISIPPYFNDSATIWQEIMSIDGGKDIKQLAFNTDRPNVWKTYMKEKLTGKTTTHIYLLWALIGANLFKPSKKRMKELEAFLLEGDNFLDNYLSSRLLLFPVYHSSAPMHGQMFKEIFSINKTYEKYMPYIAYANVWGLPSLTVPIGFDSKNMPIAVQVIGRNGNEDAIFQLGKLLEEHFTGYVRSTAYDQLESLG